MTNAASSSPHLRGMKPRREAPLPSLRLRSMPAFEIIAEAKEVMNSPREERLGRNVKPLRLAALEGDPVSSPYHAKLVSKQGYSSGGSNDSPLITERKTNADKHSIRSPTFPSQRDNQESSPRVIVLGDSVPGNSNSPRSRRRRATAKFIHATESDKREVINKQKNLADRSPARHAKDTPQHRLQSDARAKSPAQEQHNSDHAVGHNISTKEQTQRLRNPRSSLIVNERRATTKHRKPYRDSIVEAYEEEKLPTSPTSERRTHTQLRAWQGLDAIAYQQSTAANQSNQEDVEPSPPPYASKLHRTTSDPVPHGIQVRIMRTVRRSNSELDGSPEKEDVRKPERALYSIKSSSDLERDAQMQQQNDKPKSPANNNSTQSKTRPKHEQPPSLRHRRARKSHMQIAIDNSTSSEKSDQSFRDDTPSTSGRSSQAKHSPRQQPAAKHQFPLWKNIKKSLESDKANQFDEEKAKQLILFRTDENNPSHTSIVPKSLAVTKRSSSSSLEEKSMRNNPYSGVTISASTRIPPPASSSSWSQPEKISEQLSPQSNNSSSSNDDQSQVLTAYHNLPVRTGSSSPKMRIRDWKAMHAFLGQSLVFRHIKWRKGELLGRGTFGKVYKGLDSANGKIFAIKEMELRWDNSDNQKQQINKLQHEISLMKDLIHDHIVRYLGTDVDDQNLYIFIEYVPGGSIASMLATFGVFDEDLIRRYIKHILLGVDYLHSKGIVHRDIKGANVLVNEAGTAKLADFGCSKQLQGVMTNSLEESLCAIRGSVPWMAPEVIKQTGHGFKADIWSIGATMVEMATAKHPWPAFTNNLAALFAIATANKPPPIPDSMSMEAKSFLDRCFVVDPAGRATVKELLEHPFVSQSASNC